jgi:hypothetical protein
MSILLFLINLQLHRDQGVRLSKISATIHLSVRKISISRKTSNTIVLSMSLVLQRIAQASRLPRAALMVRQRLQRPITAIVLPSLSPTMTNGVVADWKKKPGDVLRPGDVLCDIDTDKASVGFEVLKLS